MEVFWYIIIAVSMTMFFILDGYDFGVGIIHLFFAKTDSDREVIAKSAGLFWDSNEVWIVMAGGVVFMAFPTYYASVFSGFYLPLIIVLWLTIFRAIGLELRGQFKHPMWHNIWDKAFGYSSLLLALFYGIALGNIIRGVNLGGVTDEVSKFEPHYFNLPLWDSTVSPLSEHPGVIDWFTIIIGLMAVVLLAIHGANWIILKTNSTINESLRPIIFKLNIALAVLTILSVITFKFVNPNMFSNFINRPYLLLLPLIFIGGLLGTFFIKRFKSEVTGFYYSTAMLVGGINATLASIFPVILPSVNSHNPDLTIYNTSTTDYGFSVSILWGILGILLIIMYCVIQFKLTSGKIDDRHYGH